MNRAPRAKPVEIFLSHAHADRKFLNRLVKVLRAHGIQYWYSKAHLIGAQEWHDEIGRALDRCNWFGLVLSPAATESEWGKRELRYALNDKKYSGKIVPMVVRACQHKKLSWTLGAIQFVKFTGDFEEGCWDLFKIWTRPYTPTGKAKQKKPKVSR